MDKTIDVDFFAKSENEALNTFAPIKNPITAQAGDELTKSNIKGE